MNRKTKKIKEIVVYQNEFNKIPLKGFTSVEMDLLFSIMSQMRDKGIEEVTFSFSDLRHLSNYSKKNAVAPFVEDLERIYDKLIRLNVKIGDSKKWTKFVFFTKYTVDTEAQSITIGINKEFAPLINELTGNFTKLELKEVINLHSIYSKSCYKLLKQFRLTGFYKINIEQFKKLLDVPKSYNMKQLTARVLKPIEKELPEYFERLEIKKIKDPLDKRKVKFLEFRFKKQTDINRKGFKTFRDENTGKYREKHLYNFSDRDIEKAMPEIPEQLKGQLDIEDLDI